MSTRNRAGGKRDAEAFGHLANIVDTGAVVELVAFVNRVQVTVFPQGLASSTHHHYLGKSLAEAIAKAVRASAEGAA